MLTPDLMRRIRYIELRTRRRVHNVFAGAYHSVYKGRGLVFETVRPYVPGDDVRLIDWKVTARTGDPFIKQYTEERQLTVMLIMDGSASVFFGTTDRQKRDFAAELGAVLAASATINNDKAGLIIFSDHVEHYIPARQGRQHIQRIVRDLLVFQPSGRGTDMRVALRTAIRALSRGAIVFLISDFLMPGDQYARELAIAARQHKVTALVISDPLEASFPAVGIVGLRDSETDDVHWIDTQSPQWQRQFREQREQLIAERDATLRKAGVNRVDLTTQEDYVGPLTAFFRREAERRR